MAHEDRLKEFKLDLSDDADALEDQKDRANEDMRFVNVDGGMWEDFLFSEFSDRVKLEFDIVSGFLQRFIGQWNLR